jgi:hypothetical protein
MKLCILGDTHFGARGDSLDFHKYFQKFYDEVFFPYLIENNIKDVQDILLRNFNKNSSVVSKDENCVRIKCYSRGILNWFKNHLYDAAENKCYPWDLDRISKNDCINLLTGLIRSDGTWNENVFSFSNTNTHLIWLAKQLCARLGLAASIHYREPRIGGTIDIRTIVGKKQEWTISVGAKLGSLSVKDYIENVNCENSKFIEKMYIDNNFICTHVQKIENEEYSGIVYDLQVEEDHSFTGPFLTIHNCGAGMVNVCVMLNGEPVLTFSTTKSGDWIDRMAAVATGQTDSIVQAEKEEGDFTIGQPHDNQILAAVSAYYERLIDYTTKQLAAALSDHKDLPKFKDPLPVVIGGGTSQAKGFVTTFAKKLEANGFPVAVKEVRHASEPLHAVARGCLIAASIL